MATTASTTEDQYRVWAAAASLVREYVVTKFMAQCNITEEHDRCAKHDHLLPAGHTIRRPSLKNECGVAVFWKNDVPHLRRFLAPQGTIDELLERLRNILRQGAILTNEMELFAIEDMSSLGLFPYIEGDGKSYSINVRYKDWRNYPQSPA